MFKDEFAHSRGYPRVIISIFRAFDAAEFADSEPFGPSLCQSCVPEGHFGEEGCKISAFLIKQDLILSRVIIDRVSKGIAGKVLRKFIDR